MRFALFSNNASSDSSPVNSQPLCSLISTSESDFGAILASNHRTSIGIVMTSGGITEIRKSVLVVDIVVLTAILKIGEIIVQPISVNMVNHHSFWSITQKCLRDQTVNGFDFLAKVYPQVSTG